MMNLDGLFYIVGSVPMFVLTLIQLVLNLMLYLGENYTSAQLIESYIRYIIPTFLLPIGTAILIMLLDRRPIKPMVKGLLMYPLFLGSWLLINFKCLFKRNTKWDKINHIRSININEIPETKKELI